MKGYVVGLVLTIMLVTTPAMAGSNDFNMNGTQFAAAFIKNTVSNLDLGAKFLHLLYEVNDTEQNSNLFQNLWGLVYGGVLVSGWNNQVTAEVLETLADSNNLTSQRTNISESIRMMATNTSVVFGDVEGTQGLAALLNYQVKALQNKSITTTNSTGAKVPLVEAYAEALANTITDNIKFTMELFKAIPDALNSS
ncbi:MAG: hypothetical protein H0Z19_07700 [Archaeoglobus sp.]|uniref:hypothetical protein n=1 Tax=Archaeoglobus sp. TaxID=1872626 RepID=UPI001E091CE3|nr:hypothetical protein [Archaeoglobus sp.]MBO8180347.1 hypothetical protein [Archaeoglobus sp.]